jgi:hypothetical protein
MTLATVSAAIIWIVASVVVLYDLIPAFNSTPGDTISEQMRAATARFWIAPLAWGVLGGHWWAPALLTPPWGPLALAVFGVLVLAANFARVVLVEDPRVWLALFVFGAVLGGVFWNLGPL